MAIPLSRHLPASTLITPECDAPGCGVAGDQYTMIHCRVCGEWFCPEHIAADEGVTLVRPTSRPLSGLAYYQGSCVPCQQARQRSLQRTHH
jgi:hypothetical protein